MPELGHTCIAYRGGGIYACSCGHRLNGGGSGQALDYSSHAETIVDLKVAHLAHRLEVEPEQLGVQQ